MYKTLRYAFHNRGPDRAARRGVSESRPPGRTPKGSEVEFANLPHDFAETLELVFVGITIVASLAIMVAFGHWWQR